MQRFADIELSEALFSVVLIGVQGCIWSVKAKDDAKYPTIHGIGQAHRKITWLTVSTVSRLINLLFIG